MTDREIMQQALDALKNTATRSAAEQYATEQNAIAALEAALAQPEQEPVHFLANGVRYKVTHQGYYGCSIVGLPENLNGQWVALVEATDSKHLNCIAPQESTKPEQEPWLWIRKHYSFNGTWISNRLPDYPENWDAVYKAPPKREWVGLTDDVLNSLVEKCAKYYGYEMKPIQTAGFYALVKAIEAKLKEKNT